MNARTKKKLSGDLIADIIHDEPLEKIQELVKQGAQPNVEVKTFYGKIDALCAAVIKGRSDVIRALLEAGADVNHQTKRGTALHVAMMEEQDDIAKQLLKAGAKIDDEEYRIPILYSAIYAGWSFEFLKLLLAAGAKPNSGEPDHLPLVAAAVKGNADIAKLLVEAGADVNAKARLGTPLGFAAFCGHVDVAQVLLDAGADVNAEFWTVPALIEIFYCESSTVALSMLFAMAEEGAVLDKSLTQPRNTTALALAKLMRKRKMVKFLRDHGGKE